MQKAQMPSKGRGHKASSGGFLAKTAPSRPFCQPRTIILTIAVLWSSLLQLSTSNSQSKRPLLIDSIFTQPDKLQLRFRPMGHYAASTFTSQVRIPFDYSALLQLQDQMIERMDRCIPDLDRYNFHLDEYNRKTLNSTFELYKSDLKQVFKLFKDLLASLPHVPERQCRQWDVASFAIATSSLALSTYNTIRSQSWSQPLKHRNRKLTFWLTLSTSTSNISTNWTG